MPQLVNLAGKGEAPNPGRPRTVSAASTQTPTANLAGHAQTGGLLPVVRSAPGRLAERRPPRTRS